MDSEIEQIERAHAAIKKAVEVVIGDLGALKIGTGQQFPYGWRKAGKGRTVWRLVEEVIVQGLESRAHNLNLESVAPAASEVGIFDVAVGLRDPNMTCYINIKAAANTGKIQKDDVSKATKLEAFYIQNPNDQLFLATIYLDFNSDDETLRVEFCRCAVIPMAWIPDVYVNPSNNGNLQSSKYRDPSSAIKRTNAEFLEELQSAMATAESSRASKRR
jgi:hypothetical protein